MKNAPDTTGVRGGFARIALCAKVRSSLDDQATAALLDELVARTPGVVHEARRRLPAGLPRHLADGILVGLADASEGLGD